MSPQIACSFGTGPLEAAKARTLEQNGHKASLCRDTGKNLPIFTLVELQLEKKALEVGEEVERIMETMASSLVFIVQLAHYPIERAWENF